MRVRVLVVALVLGALTACGGSKECGPAECAGVCDGGGTAGGGGTDGATSAKMTEFENSLLSPVLEDIREGVRPFTDQGIGICKGTKNCDEFLGSDVGELPEGDYMVMADLRVPKIGEPGTWTIVFDTECETTRTTESGSTSSTSSSSRSYDVRYAGESRGYRLMPLRTIESPAVGARKCTYKITAPHPDGDKVYTGSWSTPDKEEATPG